MNAYLFATYGLCFIFWVALVVHAPFAVLLVLLIGAGACWTTGLIRVALEGQRAWERELRGRPR